MYLKVSGLVEALKDILLFQSQNYDVDGAASSIKVLKRVSLEDPVRVLRCNCLPSMFALIDVVESRS